MKTCSNRSLRILFSFLKYWYLILKDVMSNCEIFTNFNPVINANSKTLNLKPLEWISIHISFFFLMSHWRNNILCTIWAENFNSSIPKKWSKQDVLNISSWVSFKFFFILSMAIMWDKQATLDGKWSSLRIFYMKIVEEVVACKVTYIVFHIKKIF